MVKDIDKNKLTTNPQSVDRKILTDNAKKEIDKVLDTANKGELNKADSGQSRIELLLTQIARNTKP